MLVHLCQLGSMFDLLKGRPEFAVTGKTKRSAKIERQFANIYPMLWLMVELNSTGSCGTIPIASLRLFCVTSLISCPSMRIFPFPSARSKNLKRRRNTVDFPAPDSPTNATEEPFGTLKEIPSRAVVRSSYEKRTFSGRHNFMVKNHTRQNQRTKFDLSMTNNQIGSIWFILYVCWCIQEV